MFCSKCGNTLEENDKFCMKCGTPRTEAVSEQPQAPQPPQQNFTPPPPPPSYGPQPPQGFAPQYGPQPGYGAPQGYGMPPQGYGMGYGMPGHIIRKGALWQRVRQMDGEKLVKTFTANRLKSLLLWNLDSDGFVSVTNKRLLYWAEARKPGERTVAQQEMPLKDVAGVSFYKGRIFSWLHIAGMYLFNSLAVIIASVLLGMIGMASPVALKVIALIMGFGCAGGAVFFYVSSKNLTHKGIPILMNLSWLGFMLAASISMAQQAVAAAASMLLGPVGYLSGIGAATGDGIAWAILGALAILGYVFTLIMYAVRPTFSLTVQSRAGGKGMKVAGLRFLGSDKITSAAMSTEPAEESEALANQLGAMITELQEKGDAVIDKWSK